MRPRAAGPQLSHEGEGFKDINGQVFNVLCPRMTAPAAIPFQYQYPGTNWTARKSAKWRQLNILPSILGMPPDFRPEPTNPECPKSLRHGKFCRRLRNPAQSAFRFYGNNIPQDPTLSSKASAYIYIYLSLSLSLYPSLPLSLSLSLSLFITYARNSYHLQRSLSFCNVSSRLHRPPLRLCRELCGKATSTVSVSTGGLATLSPKPS